jgi:hypothetical protein
MKPMAERKPGNDLKFQWFVVWRPGCNSDARLRLLKLKGSLGPSASHMFRFLFALKSATLSA